MTLLIKDAICYIDGKFKKSSVLIKDGLIHSLGVSISLVILTALLTLWGSIS